MSYVPITDISIILSLTAHGGSSALPTSFEGQIKRVEYLNRDLEATQNTATQAAALTAAMKLAVEQQILDDIAEVNFIETNASMSLRIATAELPIASAGGSAFSHRSAELRTRPA